MNSGLKIFTSLMVISIIFATVGYAQDKPEEICGAIVPLIKKDDIKGALEEAKWCVEKLEQIKQGKVAEQFLEEIDGWKRVSFNENKAMGISVTEASYEKDGKQISVNLTGGGGTNPLGAIAQMGQMGMMQAGQKVRIQGYMGSMDTSQPDRPVLMLNLKNGGFLKFESNNIEGPELTGFAKAFPVAKVDEAR